MKLSVQPTALSDCTWLYHADDRQNISLWFIKKMDILQELPYDQWSGLKKKLRTFWPFNLPGYYALHMNMTQPGVRKAFQFKVYCPYGDINNGFIATSIKDTTECIIFSISNDTSKLVEALVNTNLIDWSKVVLFDLVSSVTLKCLKKVNLVMEFTHYQLGLANMYVLDQKSASFEQLRCPSNTYLSAVKPENIQRVDDAWPYRHPTSHFYFSTLSSNGLSYGLYSNVTDELIAWIFLNEYNFLCHLYCEEEHRRKGYAEFLVQYVSNSLFQEECDSYAYVVEGNEEPSKLFIKLGFKLVDNSGYLYVQK